METFTPSREMERSARWFFAIVMILLLLSLVMVYSASAVKSARSGSGETALLGKQLLKVAAALCAMLITMRVDYRFWARHHLKILAAVVLFLLFVLVPLPGICGAVNGSRRWIHLFGFMVQPSEFAKLGLVIAIASMVIRARERIQTFFSGFLPCIAATILVCLLVLVEPDFGTCVLTGAVAVILIVIGGARIFHFLVMISVSAPLLFLFAYSNLDHVRARIQVFLDPSPGGQVAEGLTALGSGGLLGKGLGAGAAKLYFVPLCESDFIFSVIGEELGFLGASLVILLFVFLIYHGMKMLLGIRNRFGFLLALGVLLLISAQALVNIAVVLGVAPAKGIALPFVSSGGSSMMVLMMGVGIFLRVARNPDLPAPRFGAEKEIPFLRKIASSWIRILHGGLRR